MYSCMWHYSIIFYSKNFFFSLFSSSSEYFVCVSSFRCGIYKMLLLLCMEIFFYAEAPQNMAPQSSQKSIMEISVDRGSKIHLPCNIQGNPLPIYTWYRLSDSGSYYSVPSSQRVIPSQTLLLIRNVDERDAGRWVSQICRPKKLNFQFHLTSFICRFVKHRIHMVNWNWKLSLKFILISPSIWVHNIRQLIQAHLVFSIVQFHHQPKHKLNGFIMESPLLAVIAVMRFKLVEASKLNDSVLKTNFRSHNFIWMRVLVKVFLLLWDNVWGLCGRGKIYGTSRLIFWQNQEICQYISGFYESSWRFGLFFTRICRILQKISKWWQFFKN